MKKLLLLLILIPTLTFGQEKKLPYEIETTQELYFYGTGATLWGSYLLGKQWKNSLDNKDVSILRTKDINIIDRFACYNYNNTLNNIRECIEPISTALAFGGTITMSVMNNYNEDNFNKILILSNMYLEGLLLTTGISQASKTYLDRARPYTYNKEIGNARIQTDNNESFISGNASLMFYNSVFISRIYSDLYPNSEYKKWIWTGALALSCTSAFMSIKSGRHFLSDVLTGAAIGSLVGYFIPVMHYRKDFKINNSKYYSSLSPLYFQDGIGLNIAIGLK